jgi:hypothetical protein
MTITGKAFHIFLAGRLRLELPFYGTGCEGMADIADKVRVPTTAKLARPLSDVTLT